MTLSTFLAQYPPQHKAGCPAFFIDNPRTDGEPDVCSCGLDDALADLRLRAQQQEQEMKEQDTRRVDTQYDQPLATASENQPVPTSASDSLDWRTCGIVELAVRNPNVASYTKHWEGRAVAAERTLDSLAAMLGWGNTPPQHIFEAEIRAMKARIKEAEKERDELKATSIAIAMETMDAIRERRAAEAQLQISAQRLQEVIAKLREEARQYPHTSAVRHLHHLTIDIPHYIDYIIAALEPETARQEATPTPKEQEDLARVDSPKVNPSARATAPTD